MLLKDCPVGSEVRLVSFGENAEWRRDVFWWNGAFQVEWDNHSKVNYVIDANGEKRDDIANDESYQFEIVSQPITSNNHVRKITIDGVTYKLTPITERKMIEIDGVSYEMDAV